MTAPLFSPEELRRLGRLRLSPRRPHLVPRLGGWQSRRFGSSGLFADHRDYVPGDDLRYVDWNVYARHGEMVVKRFESEEALELLVLLDRSASMSGAKAHAARRLAGALGYIALGHRDHVHLGWMPRVKGAGVQRFVPGSGSSKHYLAALVQAPDAGQAAPQESVQALLAGRRRRASTVVLTDGHDEQALVRSLRLLRAQSMDVVVLHIRDPGEIEFELGTALRCRDSETGEQIDIDVSEAFLASLHRTWHARQHRLAAWCAGHGVSMHAVDVRVSIWRLLPRLLGAQYSRSRAS